MTLETPETVLAFWFGNQSGATEINNEKKALWWSKDADIDALITSRFETLSHEIAAGKHPHWKDTSRGCLAEIICLDQFPRNMYRGTPQSFARDSLALSCAKAMVASGKDRELPPIYRVFAYIPYEHSEDLSNQEASLSLFQGLCDQADDEEQELFEQIYEFARRHHEVISRFGRFPHRNEILGRQSTEEEREFLKQPGSSF